MSLAASLCAHANPVVAFRARRLLFADWGPLHKKKGNPLVTVDALYVLKEAGRATP
jgi:hypothetical protein